MQAVFSLFTQAAGGVAAATGAGATAAGAASSGISFANILQGGASLLSVASSISAGNADAAAFNAQAQDAQDEQALETLQGIERRSSIKTAMRDAIGAQDVANASSGVDLGFGTAAQARKEVFREADLGLETDAGTEQIRKSRLSARAAHYRAAASRAKSAGLLQGITTGVKGASGILGRR